MKKIVLMVIFCLGLAEITFAQDLSYLPNKIGGLERSDFVAKAKSIIPNGGFTVSKDSISGNLTGTKVELGINNVSINHNMFLLWQTAWFGRVVEKNGQTIVESTYNDWGHPYFAMNHLISRTKTGRALFDLQNRVCQKLGINPSYNLDGLIIGILPISQEETAEDYAQRLIEMFSQEQKAVANN